MIKQANNVCNLISEAGSFPLQENPKFTDLHLSLLTLLKALDNIRPRSIWRVPPDRDGLHRWFHCIAWFPQKLHQLRLIMKAMKTYKEKGDIRETCLKGRSLKGRLGEKQWWGIKRWKDNSNIALQLTCAYSNYLSSTINLRDIRMNIFKVKALT